MDQEEPSCLDVADQWDPSQQSLMFLREGVQKPLDVCWVAEWGSQDFDPLLRDGDPCAPPHSGHWILFLGHSLQDVADGKSNARRVPHLGFPHVNTDACLLPQSLELFVAYTRPTLSGSDAMCTSSKNAMRCSPSRMPRCATWRASC